MVTTSPLGTYNGPAVVPFHMAPPWNPAGWSHAPLDNTVPMSPWTNACDGEYTTVAEAFAEQLAPGLYRLNDLSRGPEGAKHVGGVHNVLGR